LPFDVKSIGPIQKQNLKSPVAEPNNNNLFNGM